MNSDFAKQIDRRRGALFGLAVGDALGSAVEFQRPGEFEWVREYRGSKVHDLLPGEWTDDTSMALALADSIGETGWSTRDQGKRYIDWYRNGRYSVNDKCFDIGATTAAALSAIERGEEFTFDESSAGNGSIMRLAPVVIYAAHCGALELIALAEQSSEVTHRHPDCVESCAYLALVMQSLINGGDKDLASAAKLARGYRFSEKMREVIGGSYKRKGTPEIRGSGHAIGCLEAALWAFYHANNFREAVEGAVNLGEDADTTGAVCGQIAGAYWGESGIPPSWRNGLACRWMIEDAFASLMRAVACKK